MVPRQARRLLFEEPRQIGECWKVTAQLNVRGRANPDEFGGAIRDRSEVIGAYVLMVTADVMLRIAVFEIEAWEPPSFDKPSERPGVRELSSTVALSEIKSTTVLAICIP